MRKNIINAIAIGCLSLLGFGCAHDNSMRNGYSDEIVFSEDRSKENDKKLRTEDTEDIEAAAALSANIEKLDNHPGYYIHTYDLPFIDNDNSSEIEGDNNNLLGENNAFRTIPVNTGDVTSFYAYGLKSLQNKNDFSKEFGPQLCADIKKTGTFRPHGVILKWPGAGHDMQFFAVYRKIGNGIKENPIATPEILPTYNISLIPEYRNQADFMTAKTKVYRGNANQAVSIKFKHQMAAVKIIVDDVVPKGWDNTESFKIKNILLKNVVKIGKYNPNKPTTSNDPTASIGWSEVTRGDLIYKNIDKEFDGTLGTGKNVLETVNKNGVSKEHMLFLIPDNLDGQNVFIELDCENTSSEKIKNDFSKMKIDLAKYIKNKKLEANHTYVIKITTEGRAFKDVLNVTYPNGTDFGCNGGTTYEWVKFGFKVQSYREYKGGEKIKLPWKSTFKTTQDTAYRAEAPGWFVSMKTAHDPSNPSYQVATSEEDGKGALNINWAYDTGRKNEMKERIAVGTKEKPYNLAKGGQDYGDLGTTANCYVVDAPGWYCFPLVFGNGFVDGNMNAYSIKHAPEMTNKDSQYTLHSGAVDGNNEYITNTYIPGHISQNGWTKSEKDIKEAILGWQDAVGLLRDIRLDTINDLQYVVFYVSKDNIVEGNATIQLKSNGDKCIWSWHIWVTDTDLKKNIVTLTKSSGRQGGLLTVPLGYVSPYEVKSEDRSVQIKYTAGVKEKIITLKQKGDKRNLHAGKTFSSVLLYQFGRKDPFPGGSYNDGGKQKVVFDEDGNAIEKVGTQPTYNLSSSYDVVASMINQPDKFSLTSGTVGNDKGIDANNPWNWWASNYYTPKPQNGNNSANYSYPVDPPVGNTTAEMVQKTIYDPCPVGFNVSEVDIFSGLTNENPDLGTGTIICKDGNNTRLLIPFGGFKENNDNGIIKNFGKQAIFWCSDTNYQWHSYPHFMSLYAESGTSISGYFEKWQYMPIKNHENFPKGLVGAGVFPQISKEKHTVHAVQKMPGKDNPENTRK